MQALLVGVVGTILGTCCYIAVMKYLDSVVVSVTMLSEPFMGVANGVLLHQATWPGLLGWLGSTVSILGAMVVIIGSRRRSITASVSH
jgi:drug/metabolite transporter (DMT)-like permease